SGAAEGAGRGRDPTPPRRRPGGGGHGADVAQAAARGRRLHARVEGGDACAPAGDLPAHAGVGGAPRPAPAAPQPRPPRLPVDGTALTLVRRRPGRTEVPPPAPVTTRDHGGRRHLG